MATMGVETSPEPAAQASRRRALIVDDVRVERLFLRKTLERFGYDCIEAVNGRDAVDLCAGDLPDFVLMDVEMPVMDGIEACRHIKQAALQRLVPVVFLTAHDREADLIRCLDAGGDDFIAKPVSPAMLRAKLSALGRTAALHADTMLQKQEIDVHRLHLVAEQELARTLFNRVVHRGGALLPSVRCSLTPLSIFNGDFVLTARRPSSGIHVLVGDFAGHGLPAAMGAMPVADVFHAMTASGFGIVEIASEINRRLRAILPTGHFLAAALVELDLLDHRLRVWNGGLPDIVLCPTDRRELQRLPSQNLPLGVVDHAGTEVSIAKVHLGDALFVVSDGFIETQTTTHGAFGIQGMIDAIEPAPLGREHQAVVAAFAAACGVNRAADDRTLVEIRCDSNLYDAPGAVAGSVAAQSPWVFDVTLDANALRQIDSQPFLTGLLAHLLGPSGTNQRVQTVMAELFANALDHGVLGLDSSIKATASGFSQYYRERSVRLAAMTDGWVRVRIEHHTQQDGTSVVNILMKDSGAGFDVHRKESSPNPLSGRGLSVVRALCRQVEFRAGGAEVAVVCEAA